MVEKKLSIAETIDEFDDVGGEPFTFARSIFPPQLEPSAEIVIEYTYFREISRSSRLPAYMGALEIAWWCRDWIVIACSWLTCNIWTNWVETTLRPNLTCGIAPVRPIRTNL